MAPNAPIGASAHDDADDARRTPCRRRRCAARDAARRARPCAAWRSRSGSRRAAPAAGRRSAKAPKNVFGMMLSRWSTRPSLLGARWRSSPRRLRIEGRGIDVEAGAGLDDLADDQADHQRERRDHLEIEQRLDADAAELLQVAHRARCRATTVQKMTGAIIILISLMKPSPSGFSAIAACGQSGRADAERDRDQHLDVENRVPRPPLGGAATG